MNRESGSEGQGSSPSPIAEGPVAPVAQPSSGGYPTPYGPTTAPGQAPLPGQAPAAGYAVQESYTNQEGYALPPGAAAQPYWGAPPMPPSDALIQARGLMQRYIVGKQEVRALDGVDLDIERGEFVALVGPSGSGKSTLLNLVGGLVRPSFGSVRVDGLELATANDKQLVQYRRDKIGFIFQSFNLIVTRSAIENVEVPLMLAEMKAKERRQRAQQLLDSVGLGVRAHHRPTELSGGEMQRVAVARALSNNPVVLLADEPTGNLDSRTGAGILDLLRYAVQSQGVTMILVTHDMHVASYADRVVHMRDGRVQRIDDQRSQHAQEVVAPSNAWQQDATPQAIPPQTVPLQNTFQNTPPYPTTPQR